MPIESPLQYLDRVNYPTIYKDLGEYLKKTQIQIPQMGELDNKLIENFNTTIRDFFFKQLNITTQSGSTSLEIKEAMEKTVMDMGDMIRGYGPLQVYMKMDGVEEIIVRNGSILIEMGGQIHTAVDNSGKEQEKERKTINDQFSILASRIADLGKTPLSDTEPYAVTTVPETLDRCGVIVPPLSYLGAAINIRVFPRRSPLTMDRLQDHMAFASLQELEQNLKNEEAKRSYNKIEQVYREGQELNLTNMIDKIEDEEAKKSFEHLATQVGAKVALFLAYVAWKNLSSIVVAGEFSSGKTTLLNAMSYFVREDVQPVVLEEFYELRIPHKYVLRCVAGKIYDQSTVLNMVLTRMRPDLIIVGELVSHEAFEFLNASNLGKKAWSTIHSNDARSALMRLENIAVREGFSAYEIRRRVANGTDMVVHLAVEAGERFVNEIILVEKELTSSGEYKTGTLFDSKRRGQRLDQLSSLWAGLTETNLREYKSKLPARPARSSGKSSHNSKK